jgi:hypothetical protein
MLDKEDAISGQCSICGKDYDGLGHNAEPVNSGRCCGMCNASVVIPARLAMMDEEEGATTLTEREMEEEVVRLVDDIGELIDGKDCTVAVNALLHILVRAALFGAKARGISSAEMCADVRAAVGNVFDQWSGEPARH